ncbi:hypothetical protein JCM3770_006015 [Rhodotorula araucariae]
MLRREAPTALLELPLQPFAGPPSFPGLVSSLRPIRRLAAQLADEAALLRRFTYKHKNQHKGHGWWKRVVEIDRSAARALDELDAWLAGFGYSDGKDEAGLLTRESVCAALLRLPRVMLIVEKNVAVVLNSASIFEQLIDSRAFLAFALVVVALAARLHALFSALFDECSRTAGTLLRLVESNQLMTVLKPKLDSLPRTLRRFLSLDPASLPSLTPSLAPSQSATPRDSPAPVPFGTEGDLGAVVERKPRPFAALARPSASTSASTSASPAPSRPRSSVALTPAPGTVPPVSAPIAGPSALPAKKKPPKRPLSSGPSSRDPTPASLFPFALEAASSTPTSAPPKHPSVDGTLKRVRTEQDSGKSVGGKKETGEGVKAVKRKKGKKRGGDEIDAIFG